MSDIHVFDRRQVQRQRERAAPQLAAHDFLLREVADRLADRLLDIRRTFPRALDLGCHSGLFAQVLGERGGVETLMQCDLSPAMATMARQANGLPSLAADEEALPFAPRSFDLVVSNLSLHWVNDLPGALLQIRHLLKEDGLFLGAMLGGDTLQELRQCLLDADVMEENGTSPRVSPLADVRDAGALLQRAGFALPVVDADTLTVTYDDPMRLLADLRGMGETNAVAARRRGFSRRTTLMRAMALYAERFQRGDGRLPATFQIITMTGWRPHPSQQRPLAPGSARMSLAKALNGDEPVAGS